MVAKGILVVGACLIVFMLKSSYQTRLIAAAGLIFGLIYLKMQKKR
jgi:hypothetical protein